jgi:hypothetical protein
MHAASAVRDADTVLAVTSESPGVTAPATLFASARCAARAGGAARSQSDPGGRRGTSQAVGGPTVRCRGRQRAEGIRKETASQLIADVVRCSHLLFVTKLGPLKTKETA